MAEISQELENTVNTLQDRYPGWVFIGGHKSEGGYCIAGISPEREGCPHNIAFEWSPAIRLCGDDFNELEVAFAFAIGNREFEGLMLVPIQGVVGEISWNPFVQELEPIIEKPIDTVKH